MNIGGLATMTLLDYPGKVAATIFTNGCNFKCPFCHNGDLVLTNYINNNSFSEENILAFLKKRQGLLDGVCITGGEPTLQPDLFNFIKEIKELGLLIKLDSNGYMPDVIDQAINNDLIDYIAMDFKSSYEKYSLAAGISIDTNRIKESVNIIINSNIDYEFRTTLVKGIHTFDDMILMATELAGAKQYYLQSYKDNDRIISSLENTNNYSSFSKDELTEFLNIAKKILPEAKLRGVD